MSSVTISQIANAYYEPPIDPAAEPGIAQIEAHSGGTLHITAYDGHLISIKASIFERQIATPQIERPSACSDDQAIVSVADRCYLLDSASAAKELFTTSEKVIEYCRQGLFAKLFGQGRSFAFEKAARDEKEGNFLKEKTLLKISHYILENFESLMERANSSAEKHIYIRATPEFPRGLEAYADGKIHIHFNKIKKRDPLIGKGSSSKVRTMCHFNTGQFIAVKTTRLKSDTSKEMCLKEARTLQALQDCPHVVTTFGFSIVQGKIFQKFYLKLVKYARGDLFDSLLTLSEKARLTLSWEMLMGLRFIHEHNLVHRDLKLENILLDTNLHGFIADVGLASIDDPRELVKNFCGSAPYFSPGYARLTQKKDFENVKEEDLIQTAYLIGKTNDVWAMGCILFCIKFKNAFPWWDNTSFNHQLSTIARLQQEDMMIEHEGTLQPFYDGTPEEDPIGHLIIDMLQVNANRRITIEDACEKYGPLILAKIALL